MTDRSSTFGMQIETKYANSDGVRIAYQVVGEGPIDLVFAMGWVSNIEWAWQEPSFARFLQRLTSFSRLIPFDKRGTGLSDRIATVPTFEERMDDVRAVMDAVGSEHAVLMGVSEGGALCTLFAATYPERTDALVTVGSFARRSWAPDYSYGVTLEERRSILDQIERGWGGPVALARRAPSLATDERFRQWWASYLRLSASPGAAVALTQMNLEIDIRDALSAVRVPTLIIHRSGDLAIPVESGRFMAEHILGARYRELAGTDHLPFVGDQDAILDEVEEFLTGVRRGAEQDTVLATVLVADIVPPTEGAARHANRHWQGSMNTPHGPVRAALDRFHGRKVDTGEAGLLATFDGPGRAIRFARVLSTALWQLGIQIRVGVHTAECHLVDDLVHGIAVHAGAQIANLAGPGEVLVSSTVKDLVIGSDVRFHDRGVHRLPGVPGEWRLFRVVDQAESAISVPRPVERGGRRRTGPLSHREGEVTTLVALGLSNRQIAEELVIAESTAERHVANILNKLGYHSRTQVATWAVEQGLLRGRLV